VRRARSSGGRRTARVAHRRCDGSARVRVIAGTLRSRRLAAVPGGVRPTPDRVREALFAQLGDAAGMHVLDLYAGTGALGIEALSRGAEHTTFVDDARASVAVVRRTSYGENRSTPARRQPCLTALPSER